LLSGRPLLDPQVIVQVIRLSIELEIKWNRDFQISARIVRPADNLDSLFHSEDYSEGSNNEKKYDEHGREVMKFYQDHCARRECDVCRKLDFRVIQSVNGLAAVPCYEQAQSKSVPLMKSGVLSDARFEDAIRHNGGGPQWFKDTPYDPPC